MYLFAPAKARIGAFALSSLLIARLARAEEVGAEMAAGINPAAIEHIPGFITGPGQTDILFNIVVGFLLVFLFLMGSLYFKLHALPEHMAHRTSKVQLEIVAVLALLSLFTHNHLYWIAGLLLALVELPDFATPMASIAASLRRLAKMDEASQSQPAAVETVGSQGDSQITVIRVLEAEEGKTRSHV